MRRGSELGKPCIVQARGLAVATARVTRPDWLRNAAGLTTLDYWRGTLQPMPTVNWCAAPLLVLASCDVGVPVCPPPHCWLGGTWLVRWLKSLSTRQRAVS